MWFDISFTKNAISVYAKTLNDEWEKAFRYCHSITRKYGNEVGKTG